MKKSRTVSVCLALTFFCLALGTLSSAFGIEIGTGTTVSVTSSDWATKLPDAVTLSGGKLVIEPNGTEFAISRDFSVASGTASTIETNGSNPSVISGAFSGSGNFTKNGSQQLHFSGSNSSFSGTLTVSSSWLNFRTPGASFSGGNVHFTGGAGFVLGPAADGDVFAFNMISSAAGSNPEIRVTTGNSHSAVLQVGGTSASGTFSGHMQNKDLAVLSVEKVGTGTWTLTGANTYTGSTVISGGTLQLGNGGSYLIGTNTLALLSGMVNADGAITVAPTPITVSDGAALAFNFADGLAIRTHNVMTFNGGTLNSVGPQINLGGTIQGTKLIKAGSGTVFFQGGTAANNAIVTVAEIVVNGGVLATKAALTATTTSLTVNDGGTFQLGSAGFPTVGSVANSTAITVNAGGTFRTFGRTVANGMTFNGGTLTSGTQNATFSGAFSGTGLVKTESGTVTLSNTSASFAGTTTVNGGTLIAAGVLAGNVTVSGTNSVLRLGTGASTGEVGATATISLRDGGTLGMNRTDANNLNLPQTVTITNGGTIANYGSKSLVLNGTVSGGDLTLSNEGSGQFFLQHRNLSTGLVSDFTGLTGTLTIAKGTIINKNQNVGSEASPLQVVVKSGATLQMGNANNIAVSAIHGSINLESGGQILLGYKPSSIATASYANAFTGNGKIAITGGNTKLTGNSSSFAGSVIVGTGLTLTAAGDGTLGNSDVTARTGAKLLFDGDQTLKSLTLEGTSDLQINSGTVSVAGAFTGTADSDLYFLLSNTDSAVLDLNGSAAFNGSSVHLNSTETLNPNQSYGFLQTSSFEGLTFELSQSLLDQGMVLRQTESGFAVQNAGAFPEPASWVLLALGGLGLLGSRLRKRS